MEKFTKEFFAIEVAKAAHNTAYIFNKEAEDYANEIGEWHKAVTQVWHEGTNADNAISALCTDLLNDRNAIRATEDRLYALATEAEFADFLTAAEILAEASRIFTEARATYEHAQRRSSLAHEIIRNAEKFKN